MILKIPHYPDPPLPWRRLEAPDFTGCYMHIQQHVLILFRNCSFLFDTKLNDNKYPRRCANGTSIASWKKLEMCPSASRRRCIAIDRSIQWSRHSFNHFESADYNGWDVVLENSSTDAEVIQAIAQYASHVEVQRTVQVIFRLSFVLSRNIWLSTKCI